MLPAYTGIILIANEVILRVKYIRGHQQVSCQRPSALESDTLAYHIAKGLAQRPIHVLNRFDTTLPHHKIW